MSINKYFRFRRLLCVGPLSDLLSFNCYITVKQFIPIFVQLLMCVFLWQVYNIQELTAFNVTVKHRSSPTFIYLFIKQHSPPPRQKTIRSHNEKLHHFHQQCQSDEYYFWEILLMGNRPLGADIFLSFAFRLRIIRILYLFSSPPPPQEVFMTFGIFCRLMLCAAEKVYVFIFRSNDFSVGGNVFFCIFENKLWSSSIRLILIIHT